MNIKDVYKYLDAKYPKDFPILKPKIDEFYQQGIKPDRIYNLVSLSLRVCNAKIRV